MGSNVPGNMDAKYRTAPNSKTREFHVDRKCEIYRRWVIDGGRDGRVASGRSVGSSFNAFDCMFIIFIYLRM